MIQKYVSPVKNISVLNAGIPFVGEVAEATLKMTLVNCNVSCDCNNSDKSESWWWFDDVTSAFEMKYYDVCILFLNNLLSDTLGNTPFQPFAKRMRMVCNMIEFLVTQKKTKVIGVYGRDDYYWPECALDAGVSVVYNAPFSLERFARDFPVIMGWENSACFKRIVPVGEKDGLLDAYMHMTLRFAKSEKTNFWDYSKFCALKN